MRKARKPKPYMPWFIMDFERDTAHLSLEECEAYRRLLEAQWKRDAKPLPNDDVVLARLIRVDAETWKRLRPVMETFYDLTPGHWSHPKLVEVWLWASAQMEAATEHGRKAAQARWNKDTMPEQMPEDMPEQSHPQSKSKPESQSETKPNAKAVPNRLRTATENELLERTEKLVGADDMKHHGGLWRTLLRNEPGTYLRVLEEIESMAKEQQIPGRQFVKSPGAAFIDLYKRWKP